MRRARCGVDIAGPPNRWSKRPRRGRGAPAWTRTEEEARRTAAEFVKLDPTYIIAMHCTGEVFIAEATRLMPAKMIWPCVGTQLVFGAKA